MFHKETVGNLLLAISLNKVIKQSLRAGRVGRGFVPAAMTMIPRLHIAYTQNLEILVTAQDAGILNFPAFCPTRDQGSKPQGYPTIIDDGQR